MSKKPREKRFARRCDNKFNDNSADKRFIRRDDEFADKKKFRHAVVVTAQTAGQKVYLKEANANDIVFCIGPAGSGKCQPLDAIVYTPSGPKTMGNLNTGDAVCTPDGKIAKILALYCPGVKQTYNVEFNDGSIVECCGDHLWSVEDRVKIKKKYLTNKRICTTSYMMDKITNASHGKNRFSIHTCSPLAFSKRALEIDPYLMGAMIGDGPIEKFIPENYLLSSTEDRFELLRGLMDTDGYVDKDGHSEITTTSLRLATDIRHLVLSLGGICTFTMKYPVYSYKGGKLNIYVCHIGMNQRHLLYNLSRKKDGAIDRIRSTKRYVRNITPCRSTEVRCFMLDHPDHLYVTNNFIVTHNTACAVGLALQSICAETPAYDKLVILRPAKEACDEKIGFLPGDMGEKMTPWAAPVIDNMKVFIDTTRIKNLFFENKVEIIPLAFLRGRSLNKSFIILDEAQNCSPNQLLMVMTRLGKGSKMLINGDIAQSDIKTESGLAEAYRLYKDVPGIAFVELELEDIVRHPLVAEIIKRHTEAKSTGLIK